MNQIGTSRNDMVLTMGVHMLWLLYVALFIIKEDVNIYDVMSSYRGLFNVWGDVEIKSVVFTFGHH